MKRGLVVVGVLLLAAALVFFNQGVKKSALPDEDEDQQAQKAAQAQKTTPAQTATLTPIDPNAVLPAEETVGDPATTKHHMQIGWVYNEKNQQNPETLTVPIQAIRDYVKQNGGMVSAEIVDLDVPLEDRSPAAQAVTDLGIQLDSRTLYGGNLSDAPMSEEAIFKQLSEVIKK